MIWASSKGKVTTNLPILDFDLLSEGRWNKGALQMGLSSLGERFRWQRESAFRIPAMALTNFSLAARAFKLAKAAREHGRPKNSQEH